MQPDDEDPQEVGAWWCAVAEPADPHVGALRAGLGEAEAVAWVNAPICGPLPSRLAMTAGGRTREWDTVWQRWHPRAIVADPARDLADLDDLGGGLLVPGDPDWPEGLDDLGALTPYALWVVGDLPVGTAVAVVGSRAATEYGVRVATDLGLDLADRGIVVVSGGAFGIDVAAHRGALSVPGGRTISVQAGGLTHPYPRAHEDVFARIRGSGALVSEVPPSWRPAKWRFLGRNRVIAALSAATVVVEASARSGALSTARRAIDLSRQVGAVPGPITSGASQGCHALLREGATLVRGVDDVIEMVSAMGSLDLGPLTGAPVEVDRGVEALPPAARRVWEALPVRSGAALDHVVRSSGLSEREVLGGLARLELEGLVVADPAGWARARG